MGICVFVIFLQIGAFGLDSYFPAIATGTIYNFVLRACLVMMMHCSANSDVIPIRSYLFAFNET